MIGECLIRKTITSLFTLIFLEECIFIVCSLLLRENTRDWVIYKERAFNLVEGPQPMTSKNMALYLLCSSSSQGFGLSQLVAGEEQVRANGRESTGSI